MVVVAIIGILASISLTSFREFKARAMRIEAYTNLKHIETLQAIHRDNVGGYGNLDLVGYLYDNGNGDPLTNCNIAPGPQNAISFLISDCSKVRYGYTFFSYGGSAYQPDWYWGYASGGSTQLPDPLNHFFTLPVKSNLIVDNCSYRDLKVWYNGVQVLEADAIKLCI
jgi:type II secretory pathway pseudopilin PulG